MAGKRKKKRAAEPTNPFGLNPKQFRFCQELIIDDNQTQAAIRAGYSARSAKEQASALLTNPNVAKAVADLRAERAKRLNLSADQVLERWSIIANANPNELIEIRRTCCRHCYGQGFLHQRTPGERARAHAAWVTAGSTGDFDEMGGIGFDPRKQPHPECPECFGEGMVMAFPKDTRNLSEGAKRLYAGAEVTKDSLKVKMHDQMAALQNVAKHLGMMVNKTEVSGPGGGAIPLEIVGVEIAPPAASPPPEKGSLKDAGAV